ncbi:MAG: hypothetical protein HN894_00535, partial [Bacteroidetes bacterium]|nr:hypothetical protein [Bacteroidota bacterium]
MKLKKYLLVIFIGLIHIPLAVEASNMFEDHSKNRYFGFAFNYSFENNLNDLFINLNCGENNNFPSISFSAPSVQGATISLDTIIDVSCNGYSDGAINISLSGGTPPYSLEWSNGSTTENISGLMANAYSVTVIDAANDSTIETYLVGTPDDITLTLLSGPSICYGSNAGQLTASVVGGTVSFPAPTAYSYIWSNGSTNFQNTGLVAGFYSVTVSDDNGCTDSQSATIIQPDTAIVISADVNNICDIILGSIDLTVTGGWGNYTYNWSNGETTEDIYLLSSGTYSVSVFDMISCIAIESFTIVQPTEILAHNFTTSNLSCFEDNSGNIDLTVSGGFTPYTYNWTPSFGNIEDLVGIAAGNYSVVITDSSGCQLSNSMIISQPTALNAVVVGTFTICYGTNEGTAITIPSNGGTPPYSYLWSTGQTNGILMGLSAGSYLLTLTDANGCTDTETIPIMQPASPFTISLSATNVNCNSYTTGSIGSTVSGGWFPAFYQYSWSNGAFTSNISNLPAGTYIVTATSIGSATCQDIDSITIMEPPAISISVDSNNILCFAESTGSINIGVSGGTSPYEYLWSNSATTEDLNNLAAGTYTVVVSDS